MHLYVRSMVSPVFELLKIYEKEGYLTIQPWLRVTLLTIDERQFNPNINIEFRNQAAAQTDCLLQYKVSVTILMLFSERRASWSLLGRRFYYPFSHMKLTRSEESFCRSQQHFSKSYS
ncbi:unnamed protein product [Haemonchus placei]|uniref:Glycosyltransferase family 92 protein n=1 Tax=Haemonchus placei TaxID=6290 RepID=A0A0N4X6L8_HAEPC|nr:unnamed protein product [Haemonchus placei]